MTISVPELAPDCDVMTAALAYAKAGFYLLPVKHGGKHPGSVVGFGWNDKSSRDADVIVSWFAGTDHGIALHAGRSGAVVFDVDTPAKLPDILRDAFQTDAPPYQSTRTNEPGRGHYLYAQPAGRVLGNGTGRLGGEWGEIRGANGVIIVQPSVHESAEGRYTWESVGPLPDLPTAIGELLHDASPAEDACTDRDVAAFLTEHSTGQRTELVDAWVALYRRKTTAGDSRHERAVSILAGALKEAAAGCFPAAAAAAALRTAFLLAVAAPPTGKQGSSRTGRAAEDEWAGILAWAVGQARAANPADTVARLADHGPGDVRNLIAPTPAPLQVTTYADGSAALHADTAPAVNELDNRKDRTSWWPRDLEPYLTGTDTEPAPSYLARTDGQCLFYAGKVNGIIGESESGKTWVALLAVLQALADDIPVTYFDFEDTGSGVISRLRALNIPDDQIRSLFRYIGPDESLDATAAGDLTDHLDQHHPGLVVLDGMNAAMTLMGLDLMSNTDATVFAQKLLRPISATGACVVYVDHIPKSKDNDTKGGIGAQAKRAMTTGATLRAEVITPFGRGQAGKIKLTVDKDRPGHVRGAAASSRTVGTANITPTDDGDLTIVIEAPEAMPTNDAGRNRPTHVMERVSNLLATLPDGASKAAIEREIHGKAEVTRDALARLVEEGFATRTTGARSAIVHTHLRRYSEASEIAGQYEKTGTVPTSSPPRPTSSQDGVLGANSPRPRTSSSPRRGDEGRGERPAGDEDPENDLVPVPTPDALTGLRDAEKIRASRSAGGAPVYVGGQLIDTNTGEVLR